MRTYLILKDKARRWSEDRDIQAIVSVINEGTAGIPVVGKFSAEVRSRLDGYAFDRQKIAQKVLPYERLDQLTLEILLGVR
jgi:xylose isomerase